MTLSLFLVYRVSWKGITKQDTGGYMFYQVHDLTAIEGIGETLSKKLKYQGIRKTEDLLKFNLSALKRKVSRISNFPDKDLRYFVSCAQLLQIAELTGQHAEALAKAGVSSLLKLSSMAPQKLVCILNEAVDKNLIPEGIELALAITWQKNALKITLQNTVQGKVECINGPVKGVTIRCQGLTAQTNEHGEYWLAGLPSGKWFLYVEKEGFISSTSKVNIKNKINSHNIALATAVDSDELIAPDFVIMDYPSQMKLVKRPFDSFPDQTHFIFSEFYKNGNARLVSLHKERLGSSIIAGYTEVPLVNISRVPSSKAHIIKVNSDTFEISNTSVKEYKRAEYVKNYQKIKQIKEEQFKQRIQARKVLINQKRKQYHEIHSPIDISRVKTPVNYIVLMVTKSKQVIIKAQQNSKYTPLFASIAAESDFINARKNDIVVLNNGVFTMKEQQHA